MSESTISSNEANAAAAFSRQAPGFDQYDAGNTINQYKRQRVRARVLQCLAPDSLILELNAGTGEDAVYFARQGHREHATDIAPGMLEVLRKKVLQNGLTERVTHELCSYTSLDGLRGRGPYDLIFSNFAGLNCTDQLEKVLRSFSPLLKPGGHVVLVVLPGFCLWESLLVFRGKFGTAFRRWFSRKGVRSRVEGQYFKSWYYSPSYISRVLQDSFQVVGLEGLCTIIPPSYIEHFPERHPGLFSFLRKKEERWKESWPWRSIGDYYIITLKKKD